MWRMLQQTKPDDFVIATGKVASLEDFVRVAFAALGLDWEEHVESDASLFRPYELAYSVGDAGKARRELNWSAQMTMPDIVTKLVESDQARR
jgi:GDPmannose 4,6-dehydratase